jgi:hypothetical protein
MIARLGDGQLRPARSGIIAPRPQPEVTTDLPALLKSMWIVDGQHKSQTGQGANACDLLDQLGLWILRSGQLLDLLVISADLGCEHFHLVQQGFGM